MAWTFNFDFMHYEMAGVIWVIGWCMILLAGLILVATLADMAMLPPRVGLCPPAYIAASLGEWVLQ